VVPLELAGLGDLEALGDGLGGLKLVTHLLCLGKHNNPANGVLKGGDPSRRPFISPDGRVPKATAAKDKPPGPPGDGTGGLPLRGSNGLRNLNYR